MNKEQFIYWLKGFTSAIDLPTSGQWDTIVSELDKIKDCPDYGSPISDPNTTPLWKEPHYPNQLDKYKITCEGSGTSSGNHSVVTTDALTYSGYTPGASGTPNTSITTKLFPGTTLNYTTNDSKDS